MMPPGILHEDTVTIIVVTSGPPDDDGIPQRTETPHTWAGVNVQQVTAKELADQNRETTITTFRVAGAPPPVPVAAGDTIRWNGQDYAVDGHPDTRTGRYRINHTSLQMVIAKG